MSPQSTNYVFPNVPILEMFGRADTTQDTQQKNIIDELPGKKSFNIKIIQQSVFSPGRRQNICAVQPINLFEGHSKLGFLPSLQTIIQPLLAHYTVLAISQHNRLPLAVPHPPPLDKIDGTGCKVQTGVISPHLLLCPNTNPVI